MGYNVTGMRKARKGFTLVEFMVAMSLVAILSGLAMTNFMGSQRRGRDVRRQQDLGQYRVALENYASVTGGVYPNDVAGNGDSGGGGGIFGSAGPLGSYMSGFPKDPQGYNYYYRADTGGITWVLRACMESDRKVFEICSNGKTGSITGSNCASISSMTAVCSL